MTPERKVYDMAQGYVDCPTCGIVTWIDTDTDLKADRRVYRSAGGGKAKAKSQASIYCSVCKEVIYRVSDGKIVQVEGLEPIVGSGSFPDKAVVVVPPAE